MTMNRQQLKVQIEKLQSELAYLRQLPGMPQHAPKCSCGAAEQLTEVQAIPDSTYWLCPVCLKDEEQS